MFSSSSLTMPTTSSQLFSAYLSLTGIIMLFRSMVKDLIPNPVRSYFLSKINCWFTRSTTLTIIVDEIVSGYTRNQVYDAAETYLQTKISPSAERLNISKRPRQKQISIGIEKGEEIDDVFDGVKIKWRLVHSEGDKKGNKWKKYYELCVDKKWKQKVLDCYVPLVLEKAKEIKERDKVLKMYTRNGGTRDKEDGGNGSWGSINLEHPSTFESLAMDPELKNTIIDDLDMFVRRRDFYKKVGKAWKRGYLLYGPPGTGKSSLIAAIANYLKFDIYDLELSVLYSNSDLRSILLSTTNRSVLVIEDIDCSPEVLERHRDRYSDDYDSPRTGLTLSGLLNFIDGLWSSCGDERIIVFTTNHKEKIDPALLRPGRMDMHIHMSFCTPSGFRILASNYLGIDGEHALIGEVESIIETVEVTPAEIAGELMKTEDGDVALDGLLQFLKEKSVKCSEAKKKETAAEIKRSKNGSKKSKKQPNKNYIVYAR